MGRISSVPRGQPGSGLKYWVIYGTLLIELNYDCLITACLASNQPSIKRMLAGHAPLCPAGLYKSFDSLAVKNSEQFQGWPARMLIADLPFLNRREAGIEHGCKHCLA